MHLGNVTRHSTLFTLGSGQSGLGFYTTQKDAALLLTSHNDDGSCPIFAEAEGLLSELLSPMQAIPVCVHYEFKSIKSLCARFYPACFLVFLP